MDEGRPLLRLLQHVRQVVSRICLNVLQEQVCRGRSENFVDHRNRLQNVL
jgi:hypothetical protein